MLTQKNNYLTQESMESQENLTLRRLMSLNPQWTLDDSLVRPPANFVELMSWAENQFGGALKTKKEGSALDRYVHNRIIIDGQFLQFCEDRGVSVECLYKDSIISWKTDSKFEKFFAQGAFLVRTKKCEFLHFALFHKGNQNEDEISFFVICDKANYEEYVSFRNEFDDWVSERDRDNLHIRVIDGDDMPYTKDNDWQDLFLPEDIKSEIRSLVENFLASKEFYMKNKIPWKRGILLFGAPGNGKSSIIKTIISNYNFKPVTIAAGTNDEGIREAFSYAEEQSPALLYFEDLDSILGNNIDISSFLNLMDGISSKNGLLVIATANNVKKLAANITDRPSRFDRKFEIPLPNEEMSLIYLSRWFGNLLTLKKCKELSKLSVKYEFSYAYLKELYISSMFEALKNNRKIPLEKDIQNAVNHLIKDKNILNGKSISIDKYFK